MALPSKAATSVQSHHEPCVVSNNKEEAQFQVQQLLENARAFENWDEKGKALAYYKQAYKISPTERTKTQIKRLQGVCTEAECAVAELGDESYRKKIEGDEPGVGLSQGLKLRSALLEKLYAHQLEGVLWMFHLFKNRMPGGILADDMGLGKTIQVIAYISTMMEMRQIKHTLLVIPMSLIRNWQKEFHKWAPQIHVECFHGGNATKRQQILVRVQKKPCVCITTYGLVLLQSYTLSRTASGGRKFTWDYTILDEGHKIKNPMKTTSRMHSIPSRNRIILTGTPVQNRIRDLWALLDWTLQGSLLGKHKTFKNMYELPIERARQRDASPAEIQHGNKMAESLRELTGPFVLRRTKHMLSSSKWKNRFRVSSKNCPKFPELPTKNDFVVWVYLSDIQEKLYMAFLCTEGMRELLCEGQGNPLVYLTVLKKICDHPRLLSKRACSSLGLPESSLNIHDEPKKRRGSTGGAFGGKRGTRARRGSDSSLIAKNLQGRMSAALEQLLINESGKLKFLIGLVKHLRGEKHRTLVFSTSRKMLDIIHMILEHRGFQVMRLDGLVSSLNERERRVQTFQQDDSYSVFLLTTQVGGVGLTLTGADRVVIFDPSWNPATDDQAIDRLYRIGQDKNVIVYRLITCGTVEEKIYRRQIFKTSVIQQGVEQIKDPFRYFSSTDLYELFVLEDTKSSATQQQLEDLHGHQRKWNRELKSHVNFLKSRLPMYGVSEHDLMFSKEADDFDYKSEMAKTDFDIEVHEAQQIMKQESKKRAQGEIKFDLGSFDDQDDNDGASPSYFVQRENSQTSSEVGSIVNKDSLERIMNDEAEQIEQMKLKGNSSAMSFVDSRESLSMTSALSEAESTASAPGLNSPEGSMQQADDTEFFHSLQRMQNSKTSTALNSSSPPTS